MLFYYFSYRILSGFIDGSLGLEEIQYFFYNFGSIPQHSINISLSKSAGIIKSYCGWYLAVVTKPNMASYLHLYT